MPLARYVSTRTGALEPPTYVTRSGKGPHPRQDGPHAHFVAFTDHGSVLHHIDLGTDSVWSYRLDQQTRISEETVLKIAPGSGR